MGGGGGVIMPSDVQGPQIRVVMENCISYFSIKTYVVGTQKNRLNETEEPSH